MTATILVVDDIDKNVKLLEAKLLSEYYTVVTATNGIEALEALRQNKIDLVLLDVMMPQMDGFEACAKIKSDPDTTHIPVIMVTALSDIADRVKGLEAGADEFLTKPVNDTALFARVKSLTRMKAIIDELKLRNQTSAELGGNVMDIQDTFTACKILVLNDDIIQARNIKSYISNITEQIYGLPSPNEIDKFTSFFPDLVIISCQIAGEDPLRVSVSLRSKPNFKNAALMLLAEEDDMPMVLKGIEIGINDYFIYPGDKSELQARVRTQLKKKKYQDNLRAELEESIDLATKDGLTGLFNRRYFDIHIKQMVTKSIGTGNKISMMMFDMDHFKQVNDTYGHPTGDAVLKTLSSTLKSSFKITDLIARYGGEEFVVVLSNTDLNSGLQIAEKVRQKIETTDFVIPNNEIPLKKTTSIGIAEYQEGESIPDFISRADKALYKAKQTGRNKVVS
jgi:two-component system, cell cycle response regulator